MSGPTIISAVLGALLALAVVYIAVLRHRLAPPAAPIRYGRRIGDQVVEFTERTVHFGLVDSLADMSDADEHGLDINFEFLARKVA